MLTALWLTKNSLIKLIVKNNFQLPLLHHFLPLITTSLPSLVIWHSMFVASEDATSGSETKEIEDNVQSDKSNVLSTFLLCTYCNLLCNANFLSVLMNAWQEVTLVSPSLACTALTSKSYFKCIYLACSLLTNLSGVTVPVIQKTERMSPLRRGSNHCFFCSSDPYKWRTSMLPVSRGNITQIQSSKEMAIGSTTEAALFTGS